MKKLVMLALLAALGARSFAQRYSVTSGGPGFTRWSGNLVGLNAYCGPAGNWVGGAADGPATLPQSCNYTAAAATPTGTWRAVCPGSANANASTDGKCWAGSAGDLIPAGFARAGQAVDYTSVQSAMTNAAGHCGIWFNILPTANNAPTGVARTYSEAVTIPANTTCNAANWNWVTSGNYAGLPDENTRITPAWAGVSSLPGRPAYGHPAIAGVYVPKIVSPTLDTGAITLDPSTAYWRFAGLELTTQNGIHNTGAILDFPGGGYGQLDILACNTTVNNQDANGNSFTGCTPGNSAGTYVTGTGASFAGATGRAGTPIIVNNYKTTVVSAFDTNHAVLSGTLPGMFPEFQGTVTTVPCTGTDTPNLGCVGGGSYVTRVTGDSFGGTGVARWSWSNNSGQMYVAINGQHWYKIQNDGVLDADHMVVSGAQLTNSTPVSYYLPPAFNANPAGPGNYIYDRLLVHGGNDPQWQNMAAVNGVGVSMKGTNGTLQNSYVGDIWCSSGSVNNAVAAANWAAGTTTLNVSATLGYAANQVLTVSGATPSAYNGTFTIANVNAGASTISYSQVPNPGTYTSGASAKSVLSQCQEAKAISTGSSIAALATLKVVNNYLESTGENIFFGGGTSAGPPTDVEVRKNHFFKPMTWNKFCVNPQAGVVSTNSTGLTVTRTSGVYFRSEWAGQTISINGANFTVSAVTSSTALTLSSAAPPSLAGATLSMAQLPSYCRGSNYLGINMDIKNSFEAKEGLRMLVEGNILENNWEGQSDQFGEILHLNAMQNTNNALPGSNLTDTTVRYNILAHGNKAVVLANAGYAAGPLPSGVGRFSIHGNLFDDINNAKWGLSASGQTQVGATCVVTNNALSAGWSIHDINVDHNTCIQSTANGIPPGSSLGALWNYSDFTNASPAMTGTVNTALGVNGWWAVTWVSGSQFPIDGSMVGQDIQIGSSWYQVMYVKSPTLMYLAPGANVGIQNGVAWWSQCQSGTCTNASSAATLWPGVSFTNNIATGGINPAFNGLGEGNGAANAILVNSGATGWCFGPNLFATAALANQQTEAYPSSQGGSACPAFGVGNLDTPDHTFNTAGFAAFTDGNWTSLLGGTNNYALGGTSPGHLAGGDGRDLGADMGAVTQYTNGVQ